MPFSLPHRTWPPPSHPHPVAYRPRIQPSHILSLIHYSSMTCSYLPYCAYRARHSADRTWRHVNDVAFLRRPASGHVSRDANYTGWRGWDGLLFTRTIQTLWAFAAHAATYCARATAKQASAPFTAAAGRQAGLPLPHCLVPLVLLPSIMRLRRRGTGYTGSYCRAVWRDGGTRSRRIFLDILVRCLRCLMGVAIRLPDGHALATPHPVYRRRASAAPLHQHRFMPSPPPSSTWVYTWLRRCAARCPSAPPSNIRFNFTAHLAPFPHLRGPLLAISVCDAELTFATTAAVPRPPTPYSTLTAYKDDLYPQLFRTNNALPRTRLWPTDPTRIHRTICHAHTVRAALRG